MTLTTSLGSTARTGIHPMQNAFSDQDGGVDRATMLKNRENHVEFGVDGIAILGLGMEVGKLSTSDQPKLQPKLIDWAVEDIAGCVPLCAGIAGNPVSGQARSAHAVQAAGASWIALQLPPVFGVSECARLELTDNICPCCADTISSSDSSDVQKQICDPARSAQLPNCSGIELLYRRKSVAATRFGIAGTTARVPSTQPTAFGLASLQEAASLQPDTTTKLEVA
jgi:hypothetical protein